jgi:Zn-dependent alcohol dehydrogenase
MSLDPAMKGWMTDDRNSYIPPVELGEIMRSSGVAEVVESKHEGFAVGDRVVGMIGWTEYAVSDGQGLNKLPPGISAEAVLCVLSLPGLTAYQGLMEIGRPKAGETLVVSGAAGSVGSMVGQLAKAEGLTVVGTAGTDDKCRWLEEELGFDKAINYKSDDLAGQIREAAPQLRKYGWSGSAHCLRSYECARQDHGVRHDRGLQHGQTFTRSELDQHHQAPADNHGFHDAGSLGRGPGHDAKARRIPRRG